MEIQIMPDNRLIYFQVNSFQKSSSFPFFPTIALVLVLWSLEREREVFTRNNSSIENYLILIFLKEKLKCVVNLVVTLKIGSVDLWLMFWQKIRKRHLFKQEKQWQEIQEKENHLQATENFHRLQEEQTCWNFDFRLLSYRTLRLVSTV